MLKPNQGEVPQYYVENSHKAIVEPIEWEMVQAEIARRKALDRAYSGNSVFASRLVCGDCGGFYGQKVWHSTDAYRVMDSSEQVVSGCELMRKSLADFGTLDAVIAGQKNEAAVIAEMVKAAVAENASTMQSQDEYLKKYESLTKRYNETIADLEKLKAERTLREQQDKTMGLFIRTLQKQLQILTEWNDTVWTVMVEKGVVHRDGSITFVFYNGNEITDGV